MAVVALLLLALVAPQGVAASQQQGMALGKANPIRKVVTMLQNMQKKVEEEGEKEKELYEKFMCYCKTGKGDLEKSIAAAETKVAELGPAIEEAEAQLAGLKEKLKKDQEEREAAKAAMGEATAIREKEAAAYAKENADTLADIAAINGAVAALEKGMAGAAFLQTRTAQVLQRLLASRPSLGGDDHDELVSFLSGSSSDEESYAPQSGQIVGILKQMGDEMAAGAAEATAAEEAAIKEYEALMAAKKKEVAALTAAIEAGLERIGSLGVEIVQMKNDLGETGTALIEDKQFLADLEKNCATKTAEWEERSKTRAEELVALADTIKVLNDDDALELFKKTLPSPAASLLQVQVTASAAREEALALLQRARSSAKSEHYRLDFISLALHGKKIGFEKVIGMIDEMIKALGEEQVEDDKKKEYCGVELDTSDDKKKSLEHKVSDLEAAIEDTKEAIAATTEEIKALKEGIAALDKSVAEATELRKKENEEYVELMASDSAAKELLLFAKNRLNKFYNPKLYKPPPKRVLSEEERITVNMGGTLEPTEAPAGIAGTGIEVLAQVHQHTHRDAVDSRVAPPPPPETFGAYTKKSQETNGVVAMIDLLIKDLDKELTEAEAEEKDSQADYEKAMKDAAEKRAEDSKTLAEKTAAKADLEASLQEDSASKDATTKELMATEEYIHSLHAECDWLLQYFDVRKEARASEVEALKKAKAVLSGADFSLLQRSSSKFLRR